MKTREVILGKFELFIPLSQKQSRSLFNGINFSSHELIIVFVSN